MFGNLQKSDNANSDLHYFEKICKSSFEEEITILKIFFDLKIKSKFRICSEINAQDIEPYTRILLNILSS